MRIDQVMLFTFLCCSPAYSLAADFYGEENIAKSLEFEAQTPGSRSPATKPVETAEDWGHWGDQPHPTLPEDASNPTTNATHQYGSGINGSDENLLHQLDQSTLMDYRPGVEQLDELPGNEPDTKTVTGLIQPDLNIGSDLADNDAVDIDDTSNNNFIDKKDNFSADLIKVDNTTGLIGTNTIIDTAGPTEIISPEPAMDTTGPTALVDSVIIGEAAKSVDLESPDVIFDTSQSIDPVGSDAIADTSDAITQIDPVTVIDVAKSIDLVGHEALVDAVESIDPIDPVTIIDAAKSVDLIGLDTIEGTVIIDLVGDTVE